MTLIGLCREAANGAHFKQLFGHMKGVYVPEMYFDFTTAKVLVMEWVDGVKLRTGTSAKALTLGTTEDLRLVDVGVRCSLEQMLEEGFYHADPHPGPPSAQAPVVDNLFREFDEASEWLALLY